MLTHSLLLDLYISPYTRWRRYRRREAVFFFFSLFSYRRLVRIRPHIHTVSLSGNQTNSSAHLDRSHERPCYIDFSFLFFFLHTFPFWILYSIAFAQASRSQVFATKTRLFFFFFCVCCSSSGIIIISNNHHTSARKQKREKREEKKKHNSDHKVERFEALVHLCTFFFSLSQTA